MYGLTDVTIEIAKADSREIATAFTGPLLQTKLESAYQFQRSQPCSNCGYKAHPKGESCPAAGKTCSACGKKNHFGQVCRSKNRKAQINSSKYSSIGRQRHKINQLRSVPQPVEAKVQPSQQYEAHRNALYNVFAVKSSVHLNNQGCPRILVD
ncbi:hypothetical protein BpHYR1_036966, partial [Brachionus plicatilis]